MSEAVNHLPRITGVYQETIVLQQPFETAAAAFADTEGTVLLLSGSGLDCSRYHILAADPWLEVKSRKESVSLQCQVDGQDIKQDIKGDPFKVVQMLLDRLPLEVADAELPVLSGLFGYFSYDLKDRIEDLPVTCVDTHLPDLCLYAPSIILIHDKRGGQTTLCIPMLEGGVKKNEADRFVKQTREKFFHCLENPADRRSFSLDAAGFKSSFTKAEYVASVRKIIEYLNAGDIYQANLSQRFEAGFSGDAYALFLDLFNRNPAAFFGYIHAGNHTIVSTSPERFIQQAGRMVETRPIKGTIARGRTKDEDEANAKLLARSLKDDAELTMIVDLMRNDLSRVTRHGSVVVSEHKRIEPYENVFHLVSVVEGELESGKSSVDLLKATFPGGSITGCPKIRSMEIIDELEPVKRHVYTGSIGYISFHDTMDLSIAIRTATITNNRICFSVGGGIVYDSDPEKEYQETLDKGKTLMEALAGKKSTVPSQNVKAWVNGRIVDQDQAAAPAAGTGFQYGAGVFETLRVDNGHIHRLDAHLDRLNRAWQNLFDEEPPDITWETVINLLIRENHFENQRLAVKLMVSRDERPGRPTAFVAAFVREYVHRLKASGKSGLDLVFYPYPRHSPLADYKTMNYLYYHQAMGFAKAAGADEAVILNPDQSVSETNTASILAIDKNTVLVPESNHVLSGVTQNSVLTILSDAGYDICSRQISRDEFCTLPNIILTNALMGAVKVLSVDKRKIVHTEGICSKINDKLFKI